MTIEVYLLFWSSSLDVGYDYFALFLSFVVNLTILSCSVYGFLSVQLA